MQVGQGMYRPYRYQIGGRTLILSHPRRPHLLKRILEPNELAFYLHVHTLTIGSPCRALLPYLPGYVRCLDLQDTHVDTKTEVSGSIGEGRGDRNRSRLERWQEYILSHGRNSRYQHQLYIQMEDFTWGYSAVCLADVKVGAMGGDNPPWMLATNLKLGGALKQAPRGQATNAEEASQEYMVTRYEAEEIDSDAKMRAFLGWFLSAPPGQEQQMLGTLDSFIQGLKQLNLILRCFGDWVFKSVSVCLLYNPGRPSQHSIRLIDFGKCSQHPLTDSTSSTPSYDPLIIDGLCNLITHLVWVRQHFGECTRGEAVRELDAKFGAVGEMGRPGGSRKKGKEYGDNEERIRHLMRQLRQHVDRPQQQCG